MKIKVNRKNKPEYPSWVKEVLNPELESTGPAEFDAAKVDLWLHEGQKNGGLIKGKVIYDHLLKEKMLGGCLNLQDLLAIKEKGIEFYRKHFSGKYLFGWKSVVRNDGRSLDCPYLDERGDEVVLYWRWLEDVWLGRDPAGRLASTFDSDTQNSQSLSPLPEILVINNVTYKRQ